MPDFVRRVRAFSRGNLARAIVYDERSAPMSSEAFLTSGRMLLHYRLVELIGEGGMGQVWKALDTTLERYAAVKVLPAALAHDRDRRSLRARAAPARVAQSSQRSRRVRAPRGCVGALSRDGVRRRRRPVNAPEARSIAALRRPQDRRPGGAGARGDARARHRPSRSEAREHPHHPTDSVKVLDFGIAKALLRDVADTTTLAAHPRALTEIGIVVGTPAYMSAEQAGGIPVDARADVWAFACVLYEALTDFERSTPRRGRPCRRLQEGIIPTAAPFPLPRRRPSASCGGGVWRATSSGASPTSAPHAR
jgi:serine/threonine-protein kinase